MPKSTRVPCVCQTCGRPFTVKASEHAKGMGKHCSRPCRTATQALPPIDRFWTKVQKSADPDGCWLWTGALSHNGYGFFKVPPERMVKAHRFAYEQFIEPIPDGMLVLHRCDVPRCVNPDHLFLGTQKENLADMTQKQRGRTGERNGATHLTESDIQEIRRLYQSRPVGQHVRGAITQKALAKRFGVSGNTIYRIVTGEYWKHVE